MISNDKKSEIFEQILKLAKLQNVKLLTSTYTSARAPIEYICPLCNKVTYTCWDVLKQNPNKKLACPDCVRKFYVNKRTTPYSLQEVQKIFEDKNAKLLNDEFHSTKQRLDYVCACGKQFYTSLASVIKLNPDQISCPSCRQNFKKPTIEKLADDFKAKGAVLLTKTYTNAHQHLDFLCSSCGERHSIIYTEYAKGVNKNLQCLKCQNKAKPDFGFIRSLAEAKGAKLLTDKYINRETKIFYLCSSCGKETYVTWDNLSKHVYSYKFQCPSCSGAEQPSLEKIGEALSKGGATLSSTEYKNNKEKIFYLCAKCGAVHYTNWRTLSKSSRESFLCPKCAKGNMSNPDGKVADSNRTFMDKHFEVLAKDFWNAADLGVSAHHIKPFAAYSDLRTSFTNIYPLKKELHYAGYHDGVCKNPYHMRSEYLNPENFPEEAKLPYHDYPGFKFLDLSSKLVTELFSGKTEVFEDRNYLLKRKQNFRAKGQFYLPFFFEEFFDSTKKEIIFSMIKNRIGKFYPEIYQYTNTESKKYFARKLEVKEISGSQAKKFFDETHIQGFVGAQVYLGLFDKEELISCMSFGKPRVKSDYQYELIRFSNKLNTQVVGGAQKLFKYFITNFNPSSIISYCDIRFSSLNPEETVYPKLGFKFQRVSQPNYRYIDPNTFVFYSRNKFQKHKLKDLLPIFDETLTEYENMTNNGYVRVYDCGNFVFVWESK